MKSLLLITHEYPFNKGDVCFIKSEIPFIYKYFQNIHILCIHKSNKSDKILDIPDNVLYYINNNKINIIKKLIISIVVLFNPVFYKEFLYLLKYENVSLKKILYSISYLRDAILLKKQIKNILKKDKDINIIYTFWYLQEALSALLVKKETKNNINCITRAHGHDLHKFQNNLNYQPYKFWMDKNIDRIFFASRYLNDYYLNIFITSDNKKYITMPLGLINDYSVEVINKNRNTDTFVLCSCSHIILRKRVNLIIEALNQINDFKIHWVHIGSGTEMDNILSLSNDLLKKKNNISFEFKGLMTSEQIMKFYNENYIDCFITTTEAEGGRPVSISEAMSFGIPVIATNAGGTSEIVKEIGILLDIDCKITDISKAITDFYNLSEEHKNKIRYSTRTFWENNCNAKTNYTKFVNELLLLTDK